MQDVNHEKVRAVNDLYDELHPRPDEDTAEHTDSQDECSRGAITTQGSLSRRPPYKVMVRRALKQASREGDARYTSRVALDNTLWKMYFASDGDGEESSVSRSVFRKRLRNVLSEQVASGDLLKRKQSYKLPSRSTKRQRTKK